MSRPVCPVTVVKKMKTKQRPGLIRQFDSEGCPREALGPSFFKWRSNVVSVSRWSPAVQNDRLDLIVHTLTLGNDLGILAAPVRLV